MRGIGNIDCEDCPCEGCAHCDDGKRPDYLLLNLANFEDEERFMATECEDGLDVEWSKACGVVSPTSAFNGAHQVDWVSTVADGDTCVHTYETYGSHTAGDFYFGPFFCVDNIPPLSAVDVNGDPLWLYGLKYRFRVIVTELGGGFCNRRVYTIDEDGSNSKLVRQDLNISTDWFCEDGIVDDVITLTNGQLNPLQLLFNDDGTFYDLSSVGTEGTYQTNELDTECGTVGAAPTITIESSVARTTV